MIAVSYIIKRKIKKILFEVISNSKIFNINFFQRNGQRQRFCQTYRRGTRQRGTGQRRIRYTSVKKLYFFQKPKYYTFRLFKTWLKI